MSSHEGSPYEWITSDYRLRHERDLQEIRGDLRRATSGNAYSWITKGAITKALVGEAEGPVLDIGCGWGRNLAQLNSAIGLDSSEPFLRTARSYVPNDVLLGDAHSLPFRDSTLEVVVMTEVIEHLSRPEEALREIGRVLVDQGRLVLTTPNKNLSRFVHTPGHVNEMSYSELKGLLATSGFIIQTNTGSTIPYIPSFFRLSSLDRNPFVFVIWKLLNFLLQPLPFLRWDLIVLARLDKRGNV